MRINATGLLLRKCRSFVECQQLQLQIQQAGLEGQTFLGNLLVFAYGKCGSIDDARNAFTCIRRRNVFSWSILMKGYAQNGHLLEAKACFEKMPMRNLVSWNLIIGAYAHSGHLRELYGIFTCMPMRDVVSWNTVVSAFAQNGQCNQAICLVGIMDLEGVSCDRVTIVSTLDAFTTLELPLPHDLLRDIMELGFYADVVVGTSLVTLHGQCGHLVKARWFFENMRDRDEVSWNALLAALSRNDQLDEAECAFRKMPQWDPVSWTEMILVSSERGLVHQAGRIFEEAPYKDVTMWNAMVAVYAQNGQYMEAVNTFFLMDTEPDRITYLTVFDACVDVAQCRSVEARLLRTGLQSDSELRYELLQTYIRHGALCEAISIFKKMENGHRREAWNALMVAYTQNGSGDEALKLFFCEIGIEPYRGSFIAALDACACLGDAEKCRTVHAWILHCGYHIDTYVMNCLMNSYGKCRSSAEAKQVFDNMVTRDTTSWNCMVWWYTQNDRLLAAKQCFDATPVKDAVSWNTMIAAYVQEHQFEDAKLVFERKPMWDAISLNSMLSGHAQNGDVQEARAFFDRFSQLSTSSWTVMISLHSSYGDARDGLHLLRKMDVEGVRFDRVTYLCSLDVCAKLGALEEGKIVHASLKSSKFLDLIFGNSLVNFFGKCANFSEAQAAFDDMPVKDLVSWNSIILAYAQTGQMEHIFKLVFGMNLQGEVPDEITFINILCGCSHAGCLEDACSSFQAMVADYYVKPNLKHYVCVADLLGRTGRLEEMEELVWNMPFQPTTAVWMALLGACTTHGRLSFTERTVNMLDPMISSSYVLLFNTIAHQCVLNHVV